MRKFAIGTAFGAVLALSSAAPAATPSDARVTARGAYCSDGSTVYLYRVQARRPGFTEFSWWTPAGMKSFVLEKGTGRTVRVRANDDQPSHALLTVGKKVIFQRTSFDDSCLPNEG